MWPGGRQYEWHSKRVRKCAQRVGLAEERPFGRPDYAERLSVV